MDRAISASEANQRFSELLREVGQGDSFVVISRGRPVARVVPVDTSAKQKSTRRLLDFVDKLPRRNVGPWVRDELYD
jgi:prevent-host-death family protein